MSVIERRRIERTGYCRGCDMEMAKGDEIVYTWSHRNRGQAIIFCLGCASALGELADDTEKLPVDETFYFDMKDGKKQ